MNEPKDWKAAAYEWLKAIGYPHASITTPMDSKVAQWWQYYRSKGDFYERQQLDENGKKVDIKIRSITPAKMVCEDMASLIFNEKSTISILQDSEAGAASEWLEDWLKQTDFCDKAPYLIQRMCAVGTGAWALRLKNVQTIGKSTSLEVMPQRYDARQIVPLDWDGEECTACAFVSGSYIKGRPLTQIEVHRPDDNGNYELMVRFFDDAGKSVLPVGFTDGAINTKQKTPTFALIKPTLDNVYWETSPFGVSVFDEAIDAIETVDLSFDNFGNEIILGKKMIMVPAAMLQKNEETGRSMAPQLAGKQFFVALEGKTVYEGTAPKIVEYNPELRADENNKILSTALQILGKRVGFGTKYYSLDDAGGIKTAKEVASDNSEMMRTICRHEHTVRPAIETIITAAANIYSTIGSVSMPADLTGALQVVLGDAIMQDDDSLRETDRNDVAAGLLEPWKYMVRWQGYDEEEAKTITAASVAGSSSQSGTTSLNGAQTQSLMAIMGQFAAGDITEGQAINLMATALGIGKEEAKKILDGDMSSIAATDAPTEF